MEYIVVTAVKLQDLVEEVNKKVGEGWTPMEGFRVQDFTDTSIRYLQPMCKIFPWSIKNMMMTALAQPQSGNAQTIEVLKPAPQSAALIETQIAAKPKAKQLSRPKRKTAKKPSKPVPKKKKTARK